MKVSEYHDEDFLKRYEKLPILNPYVAYPAILNAMGDISGKRIMDLGCGSGVFSRTMAEKGGNVIGVDISEEWIEHCRKEHGDVKGLKFMVGDASDLGSFEKESFDFVVMNMVLLNVPSAEKVERIFREVSRILKRDGRLIFSDLHPICLAVERTGTEEQTLPPNFSYFRDGGEYHSKVMLTDGSFIEFSDIHWTLGSYSLWLDGAGMCIRRIIEPEPIEDSPIRDYYLPEYIIFVCGKT